MSWGFTSASAAMAQMGLGDFDRIADTDTHTADLNSDNTSGGGTTYHAKIQGWFALYALTDCTFSTGNVVAGGDSLANADVLSAGQWHYGRYTSIDLTSGTLIAYRA